MTTACVIFSPRYASASAFILARIIAEISGGENVFSSLPAMTFTPASPFEARTTSYGTRLRSISTSSYLRPMKRLIEYTVFFGLTTAWRFAAWPTNRSPDFVNATTDGVVRPPSAFGITTGSPPSMTAMHEFVVPKSMPKTFAMCLCAPL